MRNGVDSVLMAVILSGSWSHLISDYQFSISIGHYGQPQGQPDISTKDCVRVDPGQVTNGN